MVQSRHGPTAHAASLTSLLPCLMPWEPRESTWESYDHGLLRASTPSKYSGPTGHRRSTFRCCCYSGAKSWAVLLIWAHSPPMVVYRTAIVEGLSIAHGRGERCQFCPVKSEVRNFYHRYSEGYSTTSRVALSHHITPRVLPGPMGPATSTYATLRLLTELC